MAWWAWPLFWPYHLALRVKLHYQRWSSTEPLYSSIVDGWCVASSVFPPRPSERGHSGEDKSDSGCWLAIRGGYGSWAACLCWPHVLAAAAPPWLPLLANCSPAHGRMLFPSHTMHALGAVVFCFM